MRSSLLGTVDRLGHIFAANNGDNLTFIDYGATGQIATGFIDTQFLSASLDDIAPLVGTGTTVVTPEPGTITLAGLGLGILMFVAMRHRFVRRDERDLFSQNTWQVATSYHF